MGITTGLIDGFTEELLFEEELAPKTVHDVLVVLHGILKYTAAFFPGTGDGDRACSTGGRRLRKSLEGGLSRKSGEKTKVCFDHLLLERGIRKKPVIGLITGFFGGGDGEIRTLASV